MVESERSLAELAMQVAAEFARIWLRDADDRNDVASLAWQMAQGGKGNPVSIAWYAVKKVRVRRQFHESIRSIDGPQRSGVVKPQRAEFDLTEFARTGDDPAELARFRVDFAEWYAQLPPKYRRIVDALASGERTKDLAETLGISWSAVSQYRRTLAESWEVFTG